MRGFFLLAPPLLLLIMAGDGLRSGFFLDDMTNMYGAWREPWWRLLISNLPCFADAYRPVGGLVYRVLFEIFGLNPLPFRLFCWLLLLANLYLAWRLLHAVSGSSAVASLGVLLGAYHAYFSDLYYSSATVYDLLCYGFYCGALLYYVRRRSQGPLPRRGLWLLAGLQLLALNSKEMAVTLPVMLAGCEILFAWAPRRDFRASALCALLVLAKLLPKFTGGDALVANPAYAPSSRLAASNLGHYYGLLFYQRESLPLLTVCLLLLSVWATAWLFRRTPHVPFAALLLTVTPLPVLLILPRSLYVFYLPALGWCLWASALAWHWFPFRRSPPLLRQLAVTALCLAVLVPLHLHRRPFANAWMLVEEPKVRTLLGELDRKLPAPAPGSRVLFLDDPFDKDDWVLTLIFRLRYRDHGMEIRRVKQFGPPPPEEWSSYAYVLAIREWRLEILPSPETRSDDPGR